VVLPRFYFLPSTIPRLMTGRMKLKQSNSVRFNMPEPQRSRPLRSTFQAPRRGKPLAGNWTRSGVARIVHSPEVRKYASDMRTAHCAIGPEALASLR